MTPFCSTVRLLIRKDDGYAIDMHFARGQT
jgi:hypothetical protein